MTVDFLISLKPLMEYLEETKKACAFVKTHKKDLFSQQRAKCFGVPGCKETIDSSWGFPSDKTPYVNKSYCCCGNEECKDIARAMSQLNDNCAYYFQLSGSRDPDTHRPLVQVKRASGAIETWQLWCCDLDGQCLVFSQDLQIRKWIPLADLLDINSGICVCFSILRWDQWANFKKTYNTVINRHPAQIIY